jgi:uncharacterized membrane protein YozB (DUF420 family)
MQRHTSTKTLSTPHGQSRKLDRWFYIGVALLMILFNALAFAPSLIDQSRRNVALPLSLLVTLHALVSVAWLLLFLTQATLVATARTPVHRRVGVFGAVLTVAFIVLGYFTVIAQARRGFDLSGDIGRLAPPGTETVGLAAIGLLFFFFQFAVLVGAALLYRDRPAVHKRLMLLALLGALAPTPAAHLIGYWVAPGPLARILFPVAALFFLPLSALHDKMTEGRVHPVSLWVPLLLVGSGLLFNVGITPSASWRRFAAWLIQ